MSVRRNVNICKKYIFQLREKDCTIRMNIVRQSFILNTNGYSRSTDL